MVDPGVPNDQRKLLTDDALKAAKARNKVTKIDKPTISGDTATIKALGAKKLGITTKAKVRKGKTVKVLVRGLAPAESVVVKIGGKKKVGQANGKGRFVAKVKAKKRGKTKVVVRGQFANRTGTKTVLHGVEAVLRPEDALPFAAKVMSENGVTAGSAQSTTTNSLNILPVIMGAGLSAMEVGREAVRHLASSGLPMNEAGIATAFEQVIENYMRSYARA